MVDCFEERQHEKFFFRWKEGFTNRSLFSDRNGHRLSKEDYFNEPIPHEPPAVFPVYHTTIDPLKIKTDLLTEVLDISFECPHILVNEDTLYILDISEQDATSYNTLVFQLKDAPLKTKETSKQLMDRYFEHKRFPYTVNKKIHKYFGFTQRCPYISGETVFVPDRGTSKQPASWYAMHHVLHATFESTLKQTVLNCRMHRQLVLPLEKAAFKQQLVRVATVYLAQRKMRDEMMAHGNYVRVPESYGAENIIHKQLKEQAYPFFEYSFYDFLDYIIHRATSNELVRILEAENPYLDDLLDIYKFPSLG